MPLQSCEDVIFVARNTAGLYFCEATHSQQYNPVSTIVNGITLALLLACRARVKAEGIEIHGGIDSVFDAARHHMLEYDMMGVSYDEHNKGFRVSDAQLALQKDLPSVATKYNGNYPKAVFEWVVGYLAVADWLVNSFKSDFGFPTAEKSLLLQGLFLRKCDDFYETFVMLLGGRMIDSGNTTNDDPSAPVNPVISRAQCSQLVKFCDDGRTTISALSLIYGWPGRHDAIFKSDAYVMAASMASHLRYVYEGQGSERKDDNPFLGDCIKERCRDFDKFAPAMLETLQGHTVSEEMRRFIRDNIFSFKYDKSPGVENAIKDYGLLAVWAAKTVFPAESLVAGESGLIDIVLAFLKEFDKSYSKWKEFIAKGAR